MAIKDRLLDGSKSPSPIRKPKSTSTTQADSQNSPLTPGAPAAPSHYAPRNVPTPNGTPNEILHRQPKKQPVVPIFTLVTSRPGVYVPPRRRDATSETSSRTTRPASIAQTEIINQAAKTMQQLTVSDEDQVNEVDRKNQVQNNNVPSRIQNSSVAPPPTIPPFTLVAARGYVGNRHSTARPNDGKPRKWIRNGVCRKSPYTRATFLPGHVISIPFHVPNMEDRCMKKTKGLPLTEHGPVFSKRRMLVILYICAEFMLCLPLFSFGGRGITSRGWQVIHEYVPLMDDKKKDSFPEAGPH